MPDLRASDNGPKAGFLKNTGPLDFTAGGPLGPGSAGFVLVPVPGARVGDYVSAGISAGALPVGVIPAGANVFVAGSVAVSVANITAAPIAPVSGLVFELFVAQPDNLRQS
jgi:hypothetical protein